jgi:argininosuccinate lyase
VELLDQMAREILGRPLELPEASLRRALSPAENVAIRSIIGGPAPQQVLRSVKAGRERLAVDAAWWEAKKHGLETARQRLDQAAREL